jgi:hypothetical protein
MWGEHCASVLFIPSYFIIDYIVYLFFRFAINLRGENIKPDWVHDSGSP